MSIKTFHLTVFLTIFFSSIYSQGVGIGTANPKATLHVAGTLRVDTLKSVASATRIAVFDSLNVLRSLPWDSVRTAQSRGTGYYSSNESAATTASSSAQGRDTLVLSAGTYLLFGYFETYNTGIDAGTRGWMYEGSTEIAFGIVYSNTSTYGSWNAMKIVSPTSSTPYILSWSVWPSGTVSYIRRARLVAIKIL